MKLSHMPIPNKILVIIIPKNIEQIITSIAGIIAKHVFLLL